MKKLILLLMLSLALLAGCAPEQDQAAQTVAAYLQALVDKDEALMISLTCLENEAQALIEYDAFALQKSSLAGVTCRSVGKDGEATLVACEGSIEAQYGNEIRSFDLSDRTYRVVSDAGRWLVCGYTR